MRIGRGLCWIVTALLAAPAFAEEAPSAEAPPIRIAVDAYALLLADAQPTVRTRPARPAADVAPGFDLDARPRQIDFAGVDTLRAQDLAVLDSGAVRAEPGFASVLRFDPSADGRRVAGELTAAPMAQRRRGRALDAMLTLRLDGEEASAPFSVGGTAGMILNAIPR